MPRVTLWHYLLGLLLSGSLGLGLWARASQTPASNAAGIQLIKVDYPPNGAIFPPEFTPPFFVWSDSSPAAKFWKIKITFGLQSPAIQAESRAELPPIGPIDEECAKGRTVPLQLPPEERAGHSWRPDPATWAAIKHGSINRPALVTITGLPDDGSTQAVSRGEVSIETSSDPVGAPIFFRDVPLFGFSDAKKGLIAPVPADKMHLIAWRLRYVSEPASRLMMTNIPTCINCHSFSRDAKWMGLDVDGPANDKGLYGIVPVKQETSIQNQYVIRWSSFAKKGAKRFGFMSQISPNGRFIITSIEPPGGQVLDLETRIFNAAYNSFGFGQVFYPTRGILAWYDRDTGRLTPLPGADDPRYVQTSAFWSTDGQSLVFSRAPAEDPYYAGQITPTYANDPNETQIKYDLYRIPFNNGEGGTPERIVGASQNGMSNDFPKVSPDGRWVVFVENGNGLLMRPDSKLYIVPFKGGEARQMRCNLSLMNSWHSFSPNGRWLVFSSKARSLFTQLFLTHIDPEGRDSPAILIENATAANRAANIPEFVNVPENGLQKIGAPATDYYQIISRARILDSQGDFKAALLEWQKAVDYDPKDGMARFYMAAALAQQGQLAQALEEFQKSVDLDPINASAYFYYAEALHRAGRLPESIEAYKKVLDIRPDDVVTEKSLAAVLIEAGRNDEAVEVLHSVLTLDPQLAEAHHLLGAVLATSGQLDEGIGQLQEAVAIQPEDFQFQYDLGRVLAARHSFADAIPHFQKAAELSTKDPQQQLDSLQMLAGVYSEVGRFPDAVRTARQALDLATQAGDSSLAGTLRARIDYYQSQESKPQ
ncbi:MAG: tetratricopeptide repeat protein [Terriglobia bacterium]